MTHGLPILNSNDTWIWLSLNIPNTPPPCLTRMKKTISEIKRAGMAVASVTRVAVLDENEKLTAQNNQNSVCNEIHSVDSLTTFPGQYGQGDCPVSILYNDLVSRCSGMRLMLMEAKAAPQSTQPECRRVQRANSSGTVQDAMNSMLIATHDDRMCVVLSYLSSHCHDVAIGLNLKTELSPLIS